MGRITGAILLAAVLCSGVAHAEHRLHWQALSHLPNGPLTVTAIEADTFPDEAACVAFGKDMSPRFRDWVRGLLRANWNYVVAVTFRCEPIGQPA